MDEATTTEIGISANSPAIVPVESLLLVHLSRSLDQNPWVGHGKACKHFQKVSDVMVSHGESW